MKKGDKVKIRLTSPTTTGWLEALVELASKNGKSLALSVAEGLPMTLAALIQDSGRQCVLLFHKDGKWEGIAGGDFEVKENEAGTNR